MAPLSLPLKEWQPRVLFFVINSTSRIIWMPGHPLASIHGMLHSMVLVQYPRWSRKRSMFYTRKPCMICLTRCVHWWSLFGDAHTLALYQITALDRIDGGITILLRSPGYRVQGDIAVEKITVDTYVSPRELKEGGKEMSKHVALMVQSFGAELAVPHLRRFNARCVVEGLNPAAAISMFLSSYWPYYLRYWLAPGKQLKVDGSSYLPAPVSRDSPHIQARCRTAGTLAQDIAIHSFARSSPLPRLAAGTKSVIKSPEYSTRPVNKSTNNDTKYEVEDLDPEFWQSAVSVAAKYDGPPERPIHGKFLMRDDEQG
jgi:hypothetical protein